MNRSAHTAFGSLALLALFAEIPFSFQAGTALLPAGRYEIRAVDDAPFPTIELESADGRHTAIVPVISTEAEARAPRSTLRFDRCGDHYALSRWTDAGSPEASTVPKPRC
jgi:hypothetical protein